MIHEQSLISFKFNTSLYKAKAVKNDCFTTLPDSAGLAGPCSHAVFKLNKYVEAVSPGRYSKKQVV